MITVTEQSKDTFSVEVDGNAFTVTVQPEYLQEIFGDTPPNKDDIVRASFEFLLKRESVDDILKGFDLSVIETYFPEYPTAIKRLVS